MRKKLAIALVLMAIVAYGAFAQLDAFSMHQGNRTLASFRIMFDIQDQRLRHQGFQRIEVNSVPNDVHQAVWRELRRYTLRNGDVFNVAVATRVWSYSFLIQITDNGRSWSGWAWREPRHR